ncbi:MAG: class B sortase [Lachnospiraceae bacterium]|nr:class B sortase [Lachnospiraceae bacterium]
MQERPAGFEMFKLDGYEFKSKREYEAACRDREKISALAKEGRSTYEIARNYKRQIKERGIRFESTLGADFEKKLNRETFSEKAPERVEEKISENTDFSAEKSRQRVYGRNIKALLLIPLYLILVSVLTVFIIWLYKDKKSADEMSELQALAEAGNVELADKLAEKYSKEENAGGKAVDIEVTELPDAGKGKEETETLKPTEADGKERVILNRFSELYERNSDLAGWLTIEGTDINYPVMYLSDDNDFYLYHNFDKKDDRNGLLVLDKRCERDGSGINNLIHGHNMKSGAMFAPLTKYEDRAFFEEHRTIKFSTLYEEREYEIFAVLHSSVYDDNTTDLKFFNYIQIINPAQFENYTKGAAKDSLYDTGIKAEWGDELLTLSTCEYSKENGRLVIVARTKGAP